MRLPLALILPALAAATDLSILWFAWDACTALGELAATYEDATVTVTCVDINDWYDTAVAEAQAGSGHDMPIIDSQWLGEFVSEGWLLELTDLVEESETINLADYYDSALAAYGESPPLSGRYYGIATMGDCPMMIYNKRQLEAAGYDSMPWSWTDTLEAAQALVDSGAYDRGYVAPWCGADEGCYDQFATSMNMMLWSRGGDLWDVDAYDVEGVLDTDANAETMEFVKDLVEVGGDGSAQFDFGDVLSALCNNESAMGHLWMGFAGAFVDPDGCPMADELSFGVLPGESEHVISLGGMGINIASYSPNTEAAWGFVEWFHSQEIQREWMLRGGFSVRKSVMASTAFLEKASYTKIFSVSYPLVRDMWNLPEYAGMLELQQDVMHDIITGDRDAAEALTEAAQGMQQILDDAYPDGPPHLPLKVVEEVSSGLATAMWVLAILGMAFTLALIAFNVVNRKKRVINQSSPRVNVLIGLGCLLAYASIFTFGRSFDMDEDQDAFEANCTTQVWVLSLGASLTMSPLLAKTWRVDRIFNNKSLRGVKLTDADLFKIVGAWMTVDVVFLGLWTMMDPHKLKLDYQAVEVGDLRDTQPIVLRCESDSQGAWMGVLYVLKAVLVLLAVKLAVRVRGVRIESMNDSKFIGLAIYGIFILCIITLPLTMLTEDNVDGSFFIMTVAVFLGTTNTAALIFVPKVMSVLGLGGSSSTVLVGTAATQSTMKTAGGAGGGSASFGTPSMGSSSRTVESRVKDNEIKELKLQVERLKDQLNSRRQVTGNALPGAIE